MNYIHGSPHGLFTFSRAITTSVCHYKNKSWFHPGLFIMCGIHVLCWVWVLFRQHYYVSHSCTSYYFKGEGGVTDLSAALAFNYETTKRKWGDGSRSPSAETERGNFANWGKRGIKSRGRSTVNSYKLLVWSGADHVGSL